MSAPPPNSSTTEALVHHIRNGGELTPQASQLLSNAMRLLDESEARFKALFSSTDEGYCFCEIVYSPSGRPVDFRFLEMNIRFEELTGLSDLVGKQAYQVFPDLHFSRLVEYERVAVGGESIRYEKEMLPRKWFEIVVLPVAPVGRFVVVAKDQTRTHEVELARRTSEDLFRTMADDSPMLIWMLDADGAIEFVNPTFCRFLGVSLEELQQYRWTLVTHPEDGHAYTEELVRAVQHRDAFHAEARTLRADGIWRSVESWARPRFGYDVTYLGHLGTSADVSERIEVQRKLDRTSELQRERMELLADVVAAIESVGGVKARAQRLLDLLIPRIADFGSVEAPYQAEYILAVAHRDPTKLGGLRTLRESHRLERGKVNSMWRAADGEEQLIPRVDTTHNPNYRITSSTRELLAELAPLSHIAVPLDLGGGILGALMLGISDVDRAPFGPDDRALVFDIAERAGLILAAARLQEAEHNIAIRLQQALLPNKLITHESVRLTARYEASGALLKVGGDWYDSFTWPGGFVGMVVGDVVGHGIESAAAMGRLRSVVAALAPHLGPNPAALIDALAQFMEGPNGTDYATVCCAVLNTTTGELKYSSAGHPPMLVVSNDTRSVWLDAAQSPPISALVGHTRVEASLFLKDGSVVVAYSDGLVERRGESLDTGLTRLDRTARRLVSLQVTQLADQIVDVLGDESAEDDVVVLAMQYVGPTAPDVALPLTSTSPWFEQHGRAGR